MDRQRLRSFFGATLVASSLCAGTNAAIASDNLASADILGAHLGMSLEAATKAVTESLSSDSAAPEAKLNIFNGQLSAGPVSTPTISFGGHVQGALDQLDITNSAKPGVGIVAITRNETFFNVPEPSASDFEEKLIRKYGQPTKSYTEFGAHFLWWIANSQVPLKNGRNRASAFCTQALEIPDGNQVQNRMARGNYAIPPLQEQSRCGTWMAVRMIPNANNKALINSFDIGIVNFAGLWESYSFASDQLQQQKAKRDAEDTANGAKVEPKL